MGTERMLSPLIDYYLACLERERRQELSVLLRYAGERIIPAVAAGSWQELLQSAQARRAHQLARQQEGAVVLFAPLITSTPQGADQRRIAPVVGVFCGVDGPALAPDPADLWIGPPLSLELDEQSFARLRDSLEQAARVSPAQFLQRAKEWLAERELPPPRSASTSELGGIDASETVLCPGFWVTRVESRYDAGLVADLKELAKREPDGTALALLFRPPAPAGEAPQAILRELGNPVAPTFSQAVALAHAASHPITVITGPPGTGKTHTIVGLVIRHLLEGRSVLIASKINQAVDAVVALSRRLIGDGAVLRTGSQEARGRLAGELSRLAGLRHWPAEGELFAPGRPAEAAARNPIGAGASELPTRARRVARIAEKLEPVENRPLRPWNWLTMRRRAAFQSSWNELLAAAAVQVTTAARRQSFDEIAALRSRLERLLEQARPHLSILGGSLEDRRGRHRAFERLANLGFPLAVTNLTVSTNLPLKPALFDTVIVDEASTCDPASLLPLLYRAKRAVIVGDPQQLAVIVGDGWKQVEPVPRLRDALGEEFAAEFRMSAFHLCEAIVGGRDAESGAHRLLLRDHFRCPPSIISLCNREFYGGELRIHTSESLAAVSLEGVSGVQSTPPRGSRRNPEQLTAALRLLRELSARYPDETIGLVTPYRAFADDVLAAVSADEALQTRMNAGRLLVGTAHRFQGSEVDRLVFATVGGRNATEQDLRWIEQRNLFNVAVTRCRRGLQIVADPELLQRGRLLLTATLCSKNSNLRHTLPARDSGLSARALQWLRNAGVPVDEGISFRGYPFDLLDAVDPPRWGIRCWDWSRIRRSSLQDYLSEVHDAKMLERHDVELLSLEPVGWQAALSRSIVGRKLLERQGGSASRKRRRCEAGSDCPARAGAVAESTAASARMQAVSGA